MKINDVPASMTRILLAVLLVWLPLQALAAAREMPSRPALGIAPAAPRFHAPSLAAMPIAHLGPLAEKALQGAAENPGGPVRVGTVRPLEKAVRVPTWTAVPGGFVTRWSVTAEGALGLRAQLELGTVPGTMELRAQGTDGRIEAMTLDPTLGNTAWTPWTEGETQVIELFSTVRPGNDAAVSLAALAHFTASPLAKASAGFCTLETACAVDDLALDPGVAAAIAERRNSVMRLNFMDNGGAFLCTGTLINTGKFPAAYVLTANHCIDNAAAAGSVTALWFHESANGCPDQLTQLPVPQQVAGGAQLTFSNYNVDSTLLLLNAAPPPGAVYSGWNNAKVVSGEPIVSVSNPEGDTLRYAVGSSLGDIGIEGYPESEYRIHFSRGIIEEGSSGSGLFTLSGSSLQLRAILTGTTLRAGGLSCTSLVDDAVYGRFDIFEPEIDPYIRAAPLVADDAPNRAQDYFATPVDLNGPEVLVVNGASRALDGQRIDYVGDLDVYRVVLKSPAWLSAWTEGVNLDTVGNILDHNGVSLEANDDAQASDNHFGITRSVPAGTYYVQVGHWDPAGTGAYNLRIRADAPGTNYTDLWWNAAESGWGVNVNHQGNTLFATLFTYDEQGAPMWLVMSDGELQPDGGYSGDLYRANGPAFNSVPFGAVHLATIGTLRLAFKDSANGTLTYSYNGTTVTKAITRQPFDAHPTCSWSAFDRSYAGNAQDLWWNPSEPGWGVNITQQGDILFATLFTYDVSGKGLWLVMSNGTRISGVADATVMNGKFTGALYQVNGPAFNASPWSAVQLTTVGNMTFDFSDGNTATMSYTVNGVGVTKPIQRQVFGAIKTDCEP